MTGSFALKDDHEFILHTLCQGLFEGVSFALIDTITLYNMSSVYILVKLKSFLRNIVTA